MIFLSIGSNLDSKFGNRTTNIKKTLEFLTKKKIILINISKIFETPSYPNMDNPKFLNLIVEIKYEKKPEDLLKIIFTIEEAMDRIRGEKNDPRTCDIDIIDFNGLTIKRENLELPHPLCHKRNFVLFPLRDICPNWIHPTTKEKIDDLINNLDPSQSNEITKLSESDKIF
jgi:2-amino-4-hydroxy-6-hydroxymethyldihydropteridine diphosphokinase